jgi:hypothetical protein
VLADRREAGVNAVVTRSTLHDFEQARTWVKDQAIPRISQAPGFVAGQWVRLDEDTGTAMITFESKEAAEAAAEQLRTNPPPSSALTINTIEVGEVVERV